MKGIVVVASPIPPTVAVARRKKQRLSSSTVSFVVIYSAFLARQDEFKTIVSIYTYIIMEWQNEESTLYSNTIYHFFRDSRVRQTH
jgi:hypothetical protein